MRNPPGRFVLQRGEPRPDRVVERSLHVAGHDRVPFRPHACADCTAMPISCSHSPRRSRGSPRCFTSATRSSPHSPTRATTSRARFSTSGTYGFIPGDSVRVHAAALRLLPDSDLLGRALVADGRARAHRRRSRDGVDRLRDREASRPTAWRSVGALLATLHPYLVWHDVHLNREILDQLLAAAIVLLALSRPSERGRCGGRRSSERRSGWPSSGTLASRCSPSSSASGLLRALGWAQQGSSRRSWSSSPRPRSCSRPGSCGTRSRSAASRSPPIRARSGRPTTRTPTTSSPEAAGSTTCRRSLARRRVPRTPARSTSAPAGSSGGRVRPDAPLPGRGSRVLARAARARSSARPPGVGLLWQPNVLETEGRPGAGPGRTRRGRRGARVHGRPLRVRPRRASSSLPRSFVVLTLLLLGYQTFVAMLFAGATRYRVPWDFLIAITGRCRHRRARELDRETAARYAASSPSARA